MVLFINQLLNDLFKKKCPTFAFSVQPLANYLFSAIMNRCWVEKMGKCQLSTINAWVSPFGFSR